MKNHPNAAGDAAPVARVLVDLRTLVLQRRAEIETDSERLLTGIAPGDPTRHLWGAEAIGAADALLWVARRIDDAADGLT